MRSMDIIQSSQFFWKNQMDRSLLFCREIEMEKLGIEPKDCMCGQHGMMLVKAMKPRSELCSLDYGESYEEGLAMSH